MSMERMAPVRILVGDDPDLPPPGMGMWLGDGCGVASVSVSASSSSVGGGKTISLEWKGSVVPLGRSWPVASRARIRKVVFWDVRRAMLVERVQRDTGRGRERDVSKPCFRAREISVQGLLSSELESPLMEVLLLTSEDSLDCCPCRTQVATSVAPFQLTYAVRFLLSSDSSCESPCSCSLSSLLVESLIVIRGG